MSALTTKKIDDLMNEVWMKIQAELNQIEAAEAVAIQAALQKVAANHKSDTLVGKQIPALFRPVVLH